MTTGFVHVRFCEIPRIYDLYFGPGSRSIERRLVDLGGPKQAEYDSQGRLGIWDEAGNVLLPPGSPIPPPVSGVYRSFSISGMDTVLRTFVRDPDRQPVAAGAWVYVLSDVAEKGKMRLTHVLHFHRAGEYRQASPERPEQPSDKQPPERQLLLEEMVLDRHVRHCAFLSHQLPPASVKALRVPESSDDERLLANALARSSWLADPFFCDIARAGTPKPVSADQVKSYSASKLTKLDLGERTLYLANPFQEAAIRVGAYHRAVDAALQAEVRAAGDRRYVLAKRIEAIVLADPKRKSLVQPRLDRELAKTEAPISKLWAKVEERATDLLRWSGYPCQPLGRTWFSGSMQLDQITFDVKGTPGGAFKATPWKDELAPEQKTLTNWLSSALWEAQDGSPLADELLDAFTSDLYEDLNYTEVGRRFLKLQTDRCLGDETHKPGQDDGLLGFLLSAKRPIDAGNKALSGVLKNLLPWWYMRKGEMTFGSFADFIKHKTGEDIRSPSVKADHEHLRGLKRAHKREFDAAKAKASRFITKKDEIPTKAFKAKAAEGAAKGLLAVAKLAAFYERAGQAFKKKDGWSIMAATASGLSAAETLAELAPKSWKLKRGIERYVFHSYTVRKPSYVGYGRLKVLGGIAGGLDVILGIHSIASAHETGAKVGYGVRTLGAALGLVGSVAAETGVGVAVALLGLALQAAGDWIVSWTEPLNVFLRGSPWGSDNAGRDHDPGQIDEFHRKLDWVLYEYTWATRSEALPDHSLVRVFLDVQLVRWLGLLPSQAQLAVNTTLVRETRPPTTYSCAAVIEADFLSSSRVWQVPIADLPFEDANGSIQIKGRLELWLDSRRTADGRCVNAVVDKLTATHEGGQDRPNLVGLADGGV